VLVTVAFYAGLLEDLAMEKNSPSEQVHYIDVLSELPDLAAFKLAITRAENLISTDDTSETEVGSALEELDIALGVDGQGEPSIFSGYAFQLDIDEEGEEDDQVDTESQVALFDQSLIFNGVNSYDVDGKTCVLFSFRDTHSSPERAFVAPLETILRLEIIDPTSKKYLVDKFLKEQGEQLCGLTASEDFLTANKEMQLSWLRGASITCYNELTALIDDTNSAIECLAFYTHDDKVGENEFIVKKTDQTKLNFEDREAVSGTIIGIIYLEVLQRPLPFRSREEFIYGGTPCVTVRDEQAGKTVYIPLGDIEDIRADD
jgi:hypothetical protein